MPYISDAERERARWMTLAEVVAHIAKHDGCDRRSALKQLRDALGDRKLHIKWEKEPLHLSPYILYAHRPPEAASFWQQADIDDDAKVFDPETENRRTLLILKDDVFQLWPVPSVASAGSESGQATKNGSNVVPNAKAKGGRPSDMEKFYQALDRLSQQGRRVKDMDPRKAVKLAANACGKNVGETRWKERTLLDHLRKWRSKHPD